MLYPESIFVGIYLSKGTNERIGKAISYLQAHTKEHGEDEEKCHLLFLEKHKGS